MATIRETVLLYYPQKPKYLSKLKGVLVQLGIRIRTIDPSQVTQKVGFLASLPGYTEMEVIAPVPEIPEPILVMKYFTGARMEQLFSAIRRAGIPKIDLKAVVTETNADWTFYELYQEIFREHQQMHAKKAIVTRIEEPDFGCEGRPENQPVMDRVSVRLPDGAGEIWLEAADDYLLREHINEGSTVLLTADGRLLPYTSDTL